MAADFKIINLAGYRSPGVKVFSGRDRGTAVREACGVTGGDRIHLLIPDDVFCMSAGFLDELLRDTVIVRIIASEWWEKEVLWTLYNRRVRFTVDRPGFFTPPRETPP